MIDNSYPVKLVIALTLLIFLLNGCTFHSIKAEDPDEVESVFPDMVRYLESLHGKLEISSNVTPGITNQDPGAALAEDVSFKINSELNSNLSYPKKFRLYALYQTKTNPASAGDWFGIITAGLTLGTLSPFKEIFSTDITSVCVLLDVTNDASNLAEKGYLTVDDLFNYKDSRIIGRYKTTSQLEGYSSILFPSAWLVGSSPPYVKTMQVYRHLNAYGGVSYSKYATLVKGLHNILKKLYDVSIK